MPSTRFAHSGNNESNNKAYSLSEAAESGQVEGSEHNEVVGLGGLHVIGTERHEARRIDNQLRGRSGRQGDPGSSQFFVSLEDDLMRIFGGDRVKSMMEMLKVPEDQPIESKMVSRAIESAQEKIEGFNFDARNHILEYDDVMNKQREVIYKKRKDVLASRNIKDQILGMVKDEIRKIVQFHCQSPHKENWNLKEISEVAGSIFSPPAGLENKLKEMGEPEKIAGHLTDLADEAYQNKEKELGEEAMRQAEKFAALRTIDAFWMDHLDNMDHLRDSVRLRAYGQKDPLVEYKNEGMKMFQRLLALIQSNIVNMIYKISLSGAPQSSNDLSLRGASPAGGATRQSQKIGLPAKASAKVGRNDPCPCGKKDSTGKPVKYKKCCGK